MSLEQDANALYAKLKARANQVVSQGLSSRDVPLTLQEGVAIMAILNVVVENQATIQENAEIAYRTSTELSDQMVSSHWTNMTGHTHSLVVNNKDRETGPPN